MEIKKLNNVVSMYAEPAIGTIGSKNELVMALTVDKSTVGTSSWKGLVRVITKRVGNENIPGYIDRSELWQVESPDGLKWNKTSVLKIDGIEAIIARLGQECGGDFIGLEDPDIWIDETNEKHVYFTIAFHFPAKHSHCVYLGHAAGNSLDSLTATMPVLNPIHGHNNGFKEVAISPVVVNGHWINLAESNESHYSVISAVNAVNPEGPWEFMQIVMHPNKDGHEWCAEHASPCSILSPDFIEHNRLLVGIMSGREKSVIKDHHKQYRKFRPGLFLFDPKTGKIPWIDSDPLFEDPDAVTITFASDFVQINDREGLLYAHVNDSFVRACKINKAGIIARLPKSL